MSTPTVIYVRTDAPPSTMLPGTYRAAVHADGTRGATLRCTQCLTTFSLGHLHKVDAKGAVTPSVVHPSCGYHVMVVLAP